MRRLVLIALVVETLIAVAVIVGAVTDKSDAAGRGLAWAYTLAIATPVVLALVFWFAGWWRVAGAVALVVPLLAVYSRWNDRASRREVQAAVAGSGWFSDPKVLALTKAMAVGDTAAMRAAVTADPSIVNAVADGGGATVLTHAIGHAPNAVQPLLALGADANQVAPNGMSPLGIAVGVDPTIVRALLSAGADPNVRFNGEPVLFTAFRGGRRAEAMTLATGGADATLRGKNDETTAHGAARERLWDVAAVLVEKGSDPVARNARGETLVQLLQDPALAPWHDQQGFQRLVEVIRARGIVVHPSAPDSTHQ